MTVTMDDYGTTPERGDGPVGHRTYKGPEALATFNDARLCREPLHEETWIVCGRDRGHTGRHECRVSWA